MAWFLLSLIIISVIAFNIMFIPAGGVIYSRKRIRGIIENYDELKEELARSGNAYFLSDCAEYADQYHEMKRNIGEKDRMIMCLDEQVRMLQNRLHSYQLPYELNAPGGERAALNVPAAFYEYNFDNDQTATNAPSNSGRNEKGQFIKQQKAKKKPHEGSSVAAAQSSSKAITMHSQGYSTKQIADKLKVSEETVKTYIRKEKAAAESKPVIINQWKEDGIEAQVDYLNGNPGVLKVTENEIAI